jgi:hypothetical protein
MPKLRVFPIVTGFAGCPGVYVQVRQEYDRVMIFLTDNRGDPIENGMLLSILENGVVKFYREIGEDLGLELDRTGCLKTAYPQVAVIGGLPEAEEEDLDDYEWTDTGARRGD